ncbi:DNA sulfur modification protein DndD [Geodermatophilus sabuli]|uniref:Nuclease SbcCD subunit C n=1 Tax=Geodermatophilus sabuli TaxID=1564158 RepID=A0A285ED98_9ACTN|nr:DNA sulfur modification protein DndD [Geodermatophilus sabuli]MBB3084698.1 DNA sulfur modification protein DndD [Geodermatophilus sabuli]SNX97112.1 DNA sulfur modification protein DndD [Geodermatophilus sabuli]
MILDELVLHNVGTFAGRHAIELTPPARNKPVVLIGGLNGAGKTTILEAIHLALYGSLAQASGRRTGSYENYLRSLIHRGVPHSEGAAIELAFHAHQQGSERHYRIRRSWRSTGQSIREIVLVSVDGRHDNALTASWSDYVETFLPRGIAGLFFFDGEQIEALADLERSRQVLASALAALLGLDLVDRLSTDLAVIKRRHRAQHVPKELRQTVDERRLRVTEARQAEEAAATAVATARGDKEQADKLAFELTERYRAAGGELLDQRDAAEARANVLKKQFVAYEDELRAELSEAAPLLLNKTLLGQVAAQARAETAAARERIITDVLAERDAALLSQLRVALSDDALRSVEQHLTADRQTRAGAADVPVITGLREVASIEQIATAALPAAQRRVEQLVQRRAEVRAELDQAERVVVAIPDAASLAPLLAERDAAAAEALRLDARLVQLEEHLAALRQELARADASYEAALTKSAQAGLIADDGRRLVDHVDRVQVTLERLRLAAIQRHLDRIGALVLEALGRLLRKSDLIARIAIDPKTYGVQLTGPGGHPVSAAALSAGERQLLAVALLWGLARAAGQPLPVVIDTPLGRLDGTHRAHLLERYFPYASHQVILLSTDTEIDDAAYDRLAPHIGRRYQLCFDPATNATAVEPGYFWE